MPNQLAELDRVFQALSHPPRRDGVRRLSAGPAAVSELAEPFDMVAFDRLTDRQAEAILNMRLRSLRKLEEMQLRQEKDELLAEQDELEKLLASPARQRTRLKRDLGALRKDYAGDTVLGARRTTIAEAAPTVEFNPDAMIEKEPVTVILSQRGWIRAARGHLPLDQEWKFKEGDGPAFAVHCQTTDKLLLAADNGRFYTLGADKLPGARGFGEPVKGTVDIDADAGIAGLMVHRPKGQLLLAATTGKGFAAEMEKLLAETRKGRQVVNLKGDAKLRVVREIAPEHDHIAVVGDNRKLVIFNLEELPVMARGQGVTLQRYRDGGLSDATTLRWAGRAGAPVPKRMCANGRWPAARPAACRRAVSRKTTGSRKTKGRTSAGMPGLSVQMWMFSRPAVRLRPIRPAAPRSARR